MAKSIYPASGGMPQPGTQKTPKPAPKPAPKKKKVPGGAIE